MRPSDFHDPEFASAARAAAEAGVHFRAVRCAVGLDGSRIDLELPVDLAPYDTTPIAAYWEANRETTGWVRGASGQRVANGPFAHNKAPKARSPGSKSKASPVGDTKGAGAGKEPDAGDSRKASRYFE